jgi:hypothetical protein
VVLRIDVVRLFQLKRGQSEIQALPDLLERDVAHRQKSLNRSGDSSVISLLTYAAPASSSRKGSSRSSIRIT